MAIVGNATPSRTANDSAPATDVADRVVALAPRTTADSAPATDAVGRLGTYGRAVADSAAATDAVTRSLTLVVRAAADSAPATDVAGRTVALATRTTADSAPATDAAGRFGTHGRTAADSAAATDAVTRSLTLVVRAAADSAPATDVAGRFGTYGRAVADSAPATDTAAGAVARNRTAADNAAATDAVTRSLTLVVRTAADSAPASDSATGTHPPTVRSATDSAPATDAVNRAAITRARGAADNAAATDAATRTVALLRSATDSAPATDTAAAVNPAVSRGATDSAPATDVATRAAISRSRSAADSAPATDAVTRTVALVFRHADDSAPAADVAGAKVARLVFDNAAATDAVTRTVTLVRTAADSAPATDVAGQNLLIRNINDTAHATDVATRTVALATRTAADTAAATDVAAGHAAHARTAADSAPATDVVNGIPLRPRTAADTAHATDTASRAPISYVRTVADAAGGATDTLAFFVVGTGAAPILPNPNWPAVGVDVDFGVAAGPPNVPTTRQSLNASSLHRMITRRIGIKRGRQYELDQVQTGSCELDIPDPLEQLNADNPASPYNDGVVDSLAPYRPMQVWAMWPNQPGSGNILSLKSTRVDPSFANGIGHFDGTVNGTGTLANVTTPAFSGVHAMQVTQAGSGLVYGAYIKKWTRTMPGITYCFSAYVYATAGCTVNVGVVDAAGNIHVGNTSILQNGWRRIFVPWTPLDTQEQIVIWGSGVATPVFYVDSYQLEFGSTPGTWVENSGPTFYPLFTGYVERFPSTYDMNGSRAQRPLTGVDALAQLALTTVRQSYARTVAADNPLVLMNMDDASAPPLITNRGTNAQGQLVIGGEGGISFNGDTLPDGAPAVALTQTLSATVAGTSTTLSAATAVGATTITVGASIPVGSYIVIDDGNAGEEWCYVTSLSGSTAPFTLGVTRQQLALVALKTAHANGVSVQVGQQRTSYITTRPETAIPANFTGFTLEFWAKPVVGNVTMVAGENITNSPTIMPLQSAGSSKRDTFIGLQSDGNALHLVLNDTGNASLGGQLNAYADPAVSGYSPFPDGSWHYYAVTVYTNPSNTSQYLWKARVDTNAPRHAGAVGTPAIRVARFNEVMTAVSVESGTQAGLSVGRIAFYGYALSDDQTLAHAQRGWGNINEVSGTRAGRLLDTYWAGATSVADGFLQLADDFTYDPTITTNAGTASAGQARAVLDVLQEIQESERGLVYAAADGTVVVEDRESRYTAQTSKATFGEDPTNTGVEYPYTDYAADFDPTYTFSQANLTSPYNQNWLPLVNATAQAKYGQRLVSQQLQCVRDFDIEQAGVFYLTRYSGPRTRISKIVFKPSANPALWPLVLGFELSQRYTVKRRSPSGVLVSGDHYIESIEHGIDPEGGDWTVTVQMSPVFVPTAWVLGDSTYGVLGTTTIPIY